MSNESTRNTIIFVVSAVVILFVYQALVLGPAAERQRVEAERAEAAVQAQAQAQAQGAPAGVGAPGAAPGQAFVPREQAATASPRVPIDNARVSGSVSLKGGRIDDLFLKSYRQTTAADSPPVELFRPEGAQHAFFADFGWTASDPRGLPGRDTVWRAPEGAVLAPGKPVVLTYDNGQGLVFARRISVDDRYMFTVTDAVANRGAAPVSLAPYAAVQRQGLPADLGKNHIIHEGAVGATGDGKLKLSKYDGWRKDGTTELPSTGGWLGVTDKYWLAAVIPPQDEAIKGQFRVTQTPGLDVYDANFLGPLQTVEPGQTVTQTTRLFAGAKVVPILRDYERVLGAPRLVDAVDWGMFWFFTKPIFQLLEIFFHMVGNFGVAILLLTVAVKALFFPLANKSYESLSKMKKIQPEMEKIKKRNEKDPAKQQQELMQLYQKEKINPFMGCLPIVIQIPVFYALYKVLSVTLEMRHAPFFGWIQDLSARDPTSIWTAFGLIPWDPAAAPLIGGFLNGPLHIGVWPIIMGFTMWLQQAMSPPAGIDPIQQRIFQFLPFIFTFMLAPFAAGLVIYWTWNNLLSILQQYVIMRRFKVDNPIDSLIARLKTGKAKAG